MSEESIVIIQHNRLKKYNYCSYGAYLKNWSKYNWKLLYKVIKPISKVVGNEKIKICIR